MVMTRDVRNLRLMSLDWTSRHLRGSSEPREPRDISTTNAPPSIIAIVPQRCSVFFLFPQEINSPYRVSHERRQHSLYFAFVLSLVLHAPRPPHLRRHLTRFPSSPLSVLSIFTRYPPPPVLTPPLPVCVALPWKTLCAPFNWSHAERGVSYLPLSHVAGQVSQQPFRHHGIWRVKRFFRNNSITARTTTTRGCRVCATSVSQTPVW